MTDRTERWISEEKAYRTRKKREKVERTKEVRLNGLRRQKVRQEKAEVRVNGLSRQRMRRTSKEALRNSL